MEASETHSSQTPAQGKEKPRRTYTELEAVDAGTTQSSGDGEQEEKLRENWLLGSMRKTHARFKLCHAFRCSFVFPQFSGDKRLTCGGEPIVHDRGASTGKEPLRPLHEHS